MNTHLIKTDILILGAGIGGYEAFRSLQKEFKKHNIDKHITIVDKNNYFTFIPMLHEVAAGSIEPDHCAIPIRELIYGSSHTFIQTEVKRIYPEKKEVTTSEGTISYDQCIVALGSTTNYFGVPGAAEYAYHVRSLRGAVSLHHALIEQLEDAKVRDINMVIVGGGYTGVEVAGQFCDFVKDEVRKIYPEKKVAIHIVESGDLLLKVMPNKVRKRITKRLRDQGIKMHLQSRVKKVTKKDVTLTSGEVIDSDITIWTTGFENIAPTFLAKSLTDHDRIPVTEHLYHEKYPSLFAIGDIMLRKDEADIPYPQLAEAAHKEGMYVAKYIARTEKGKKTKPFHFRAKGSLMPVGDWFGVLVIGKFVLFGRLAWWIRRTVYLAFMPGILRKIKIAIDWTIHSFGFRYILDTHWDVTTHEHKKNS